MSNSALKAGLAFAAASICSLDISGVVALLGKHRNPQPVPPPLRELAREKGFNLDSAMKGRAGRHLVRLTDLKTGEPVENPVRISGFTLNEAIRYLHQLPDRSGGKAAIAI